MRSLPLLFLLCIPRLHADEQPDRTQNASPVYTVPAEDLACYMNYSGYTELGNPGSRVFVDEIGPKALAMIDQAQERLLFSLFLFDNFYADTSNEVDVVTLITDRVLAKKAVHPDMAIAFIFDPSHKAYADRISPAEKRLLEAGVDVFYSDLISGLRRATYLGLRETTGHLGRALDTVTFNGWGNLWQGVGNLLTAPGPKFDDTRISASTVYNAVLMKANHRKFLVADRGDGSLEVMFTSANPHNASARHENSALTVVGAPADYVYQMLREDMKHSTKLGHRYSRWHADADRAYKKQFFKTTWPSRTIGEKAPRDIPDPAQVQVVSESEIPKAILRALGAVEADDELRIQMFYLSYQPVLDALVQAAGKVKPPIRLLLDANKDSFNKEKDGTPNRQVARWLLTQSDNIQIRWYATHGEQNHAKIMSISNPSSAKYWITTGSCNWTGRNMAGVNMESNLLVENAPQLNRHFNVLFDRFWNNEGPLTFSLPYETYKEQTAEDWKWRKGEAPYFYSTF